MVTTKTIKKVTCPRCNGDGHYKSVIGWRTENFIVRCPACNGSGEIKKVEGIVSISEQHAYSLSAMVKWFRKLILEAKMPATAERSDELTAEYCDELLEDLEDGD